MRFHALLIPLLLASSAWAADIKVENAWIREPAPGQVVVGGFLDITSQKDASLIAVSSPVAGMIELHEMSMKDGMMMMRPLNMIALPKGQTVKLEPGGLHLMVEKLKQPLKAGNMVPLTLKVQTGNRVVEVRVSAEVRSMNAPASHPH